MNAPPEDGPELRQQLIDTALAMNAAGINVNKSGNVSARCARGNSNGFIVTPSAIAYDALAPEDIVFIDRDQRAHGRRQPSTEWRFHADIYHARPEFAAIVHTHSSHATALACQAMPIPSFHYMVAVAGGDDIRCAPYATFGTQQLSDHALAALSGRRACLLESHGVIACGSSLFGALSLAIEVENLAKTYLHVSSLGPPRLLSKAQMQEVLVKFESYGKP